MAPAIVGYSGLQVNPVVQFEDCSNLSLETKDEGQFVQICRLIINKLEMTLSNYNIK